MTYDIEITRFTPGPTVERHTSETPEAAAQRVQLDVRTQFVLFVAALERERNVDWGNFYLWCNAERALIQLNEHCEHFARDPQIPLGDDSTVLFQDEDGSSFSVPHHQTLAPEQALAALLFWLPDQQHTPALEWS